MATVARELPQARKRKEKRPVDVGQIPQWKLMVRRFMQSKLSVGGGIALIILYLLALLGDFLAPYPADQLDSNYAWASPTKITLVGGRPAIYGIKQELDPERFEWVYTIDPNTTYPIRFFVPGYEYRLFGIIPTNRHLFGVEEPQKIYIWGADKQGRDVFTRVMKGAQISLSVGLVGVALSITLGAIIGTASGYFGGAIDNVMQRVIELIQSFPDLPLYAAIAAALPSDMPVVRRFFLITLVLALINWTGLARQVRGKVLSYRSADYTAAALAAGASHTRIILTHMVPNSLSHIIVVAALAIPSTIGAETALSFLGLGILPPAVSWGVLIRDATNIQTVTTYPWLMIPFAAVIITILCWYFLGDGLRDAVDPYG